MKDKLEQYGHTSQVQFEKDKQIRLKGQIGLVSDKRC